MRKLIAVGILVLVAGCDSKTPTAPPFVPPPPPAAQTPRPTPAPPSTTVGYWKFVGHFNGEPLGVMNGYGFDIDQHNTTAGTIRGRSVFPIGGLTGLMTGTVSPTGRVVWQTRYGIDTENGTMQLDATRRRMTGEIIFELNSINFRIRYFDMVMELQP